MSDKKADDGRNRVKVSSVAGYLFMPQFGRCLHGFGHVFPVFMRTLGIMFAQANLIPRDHPAIRYGYPGVPRTGFSGIMASAWHTLRAKRATPYQWGTYISVLLLCLTLAGGFTHAVVVGALGVGSVARAQIFTLEGVNEDTSSRTMMGMDDYNGTYVPPDGGTAGTAALMGNSPFDYRFNDCGAAPTAGGTQADEDAEEVDDDCRGHDDFAIMLLDKVLRQGTHNVGGYLQNGMQAMMAIYNTGVLVVAGLMLFWAVLAVVVDTAKSGTIGGGKHNMVWAPIRIVFALGLLMPLGTTDCSAVDGRGTVCGFSSGQLMVQKMAEWGSNLGTNAWQAYLKGATQQALLSTVNIDNATPLVAQYANMWLCRVFYNTFTWQATNGESGNAGVAPSTGSPPIDGTPPNEHTVIRVRSIGEPPSAGPPVAGEGNDKLNTWSYTFTTASNANLCGKVVLPYPFGDAASRAARRPGASAWQRGVQIFKDRINGYHSSAPNDGAAATKANWNALFDDESSNFGTSCTSCGETGPLRMDFWARAWACDMAIRYFPGVDTTADPPEPNIDWSPLIRSGNCTGEIEEEGYTTNRVSRETATSPVQGALIGLCSDRIPEEMNTSSAAYPIATPPSNASEINCIQKMTQLHSNMINESITNALSSETTVSGPTYKGLTEYFYDEITFSDRGWADMGSWHLKLTQVNKALDWAKRVQVNIQNGGLVHTDLLREVSAATGGSALDQDLLRAINTADQWWKSAGQKAAGHDVATIPINGCGVPGTPACPPVGFQASADADMQRRRISPAAVDGGATELGLQSAGIGFLTPTADPASVFLKGVMDYTSGKSPLWVLDVLQPGANNIYPYTQLIQIGNSILKMGFNMAIASTILAMAAAALSGQAGGIVFGLVASPIAGIISAVSSTFILSGLLLGYWVPLLPFIRVAFAVMSWIVSVFEAVVMIPIAALNHISTEGEGLAGHARNAWILWLNILLRPVLTVIGYVGGIMVFNGFIVYFNRAMASTVVSSFSKADGAINLVEWLVVTVVYVGSMYIVANASFKLLEGIPNAFFRWMGGQHDTNFEDHSIVGGLIQRAGASAQEVAGGFRQAGQTAGYAAKEWAKPKEDAAVGPTAGNPMPNPNREPRQ